MAKVHCSKCGVSGHSKNPYLRSTFLNDRALAVREMILPTVIEDGKMKLRFRTLDYFFEKCIEQIISILLFGVIKDGQAKYFACDHEFIFNEGEVSDI